MSVLQMTTKCIVDIKRNKIASQISPKAPILKAVITPRYDASQSGLIQIQHGSRGPSRDGLAV